MTEPAIIDGTLPDVSQLNTADVASTVGQTTPQELGDSLTLAELNTHLGKNFTTKDAALKSFKDTFSFVTTREADIRKKVEAEFKDDDRFNKLANEIAEERKERFYLQNPQFTPYRKTIEKFGGSPTDVVNSDEFKDIFGKLSEYDKTVKLKTVLESNPRIASSRDSITKARDLKYQQGGVVNDDVKKLATDAVIDAFELR